LFLAVMALIDGPPEYRSIFDVSIEVSSRAASDFREFAVPHCGRDYMAVDANYNGAPVELNIISTVLSFRGGRRKEPPFSLRS
jgi:hypothetical protein